MRVIVCLLLALGISAQAAVPPPSFPTKLETWESVGALRQDDPRLDGAALNPTFIKAHNQDPSSTWRAGVNARFADVTLRAAARQCGVLRDPSGQSVLPSRPAFSAAQVEAIPSSVDWRTDPRASGCPSVKEIRDQSDCGSCWAFGSVEAMTDRRCIMSNASHTEHLSAQDPTSCDVLGDMGCNGGIPATVYLYYKLFGIVTGGQYGDKSMCYSYELAPCAHHINGTKYPPCTGDAATPKCAAKCVDNGADWEKSKIKGGESYSVCQQGQRSNIAGAAASSCADQMAAEIATNGPITAMFFVHQDFLSYKSGVYIYDGKSPMLGGHAIKILGYGTENNVPYWLVANSWNAGWGDQGYFKIRRGTNECQIEDPLIDGGPVAGKPLL